MRSLLANLRLSRRPSARVLKSYPLVPLESYGGKLYSNELRIDIAKSMSREAEHNDQDPHFTAVCQDDKGKYLGTEHFPVKKKE